METPRELPVEMWHLIGYNYLNAFDVINFTHACRAHRELFSRREWKTLCEKNGIAIKNFNWSNAHIVDSTRLSHIKHAIADRWNTIYKIFMRVKLLLRDQPATVIYYIPLYAMVYRMDIDIVYTAYHKYITTEGYTSTDLNMILMNNNICSGLVVCPNMWVDKDIITDSCDVPADTIGKWARCRYYLMLTRQKQIKNLEKVAQCSEDTEIRKFSRQFAANMRARNMPMPAPLKIQKILARNVLAEDALTEGELTERIRLVPRRSFRLELLEILKQLCTEPNRSPDSILAEYRIIKYRKYACDIIKSGAYRANTKQHRYNTIACDQNRSSRRALIRNEIGMYHTGPFVVLQSRVDAESELETVD